jgi:hypothetical protein
VTQSQITPRHHRRKHRTENRLRVWSREAPELIWLVVAVVGFLLLAVYPRARHALLDTARRTAETAIPAARNLQERLLAAIVGRSAAEIAGALLLFLGLAMIVYRLRRRLMHSPALTDVHCLRCGGEIHRVHRHLPDRIINWFVPVRRYRCSDKDCRWEGVRVSRSDTALPAPRRP